MPPVSTLETVLRRDRAIVITGLAVVAALGWAYIVHLASAMGSMQAGLDVAMPQTAAWGPADLWLLFVMWVVMMVAMMVPSAAPLILMVAVVNRQRRQRADPLTPVGLFLLGYLLVWTASSAVATFLQWGLHAAALLSPAMTSTSPILGGLLLLGAGLFQFSPSSTPASSTAGRRWGSCWDIGVRAPAALCAWGSNTVSTASGAAGC